MRGARTLATLSVIAGSAALLAAVVPAAIGATPPLELSETSAVPGQVVLLSGRGITTKPKVTIAGKKASVVSKKRRKLGVEVPNVKPGKAAVIVRAAGHRLTGRLKVKRGFSGDVKPSLEPLRAASADVGAHGGVITATGSNGTTYELTIPAKALVATTTITLTPVASLGKFPGGGDAHAVQFAPDGLSFAIPAMLRITPPKPLAGAVGLAYAGSGEDLTLAPASTVGGSLVVEIRHFTGGGGTSITERQFEDLVAAIAAQPISLEAAGHFFRDYRSVPASWCNSSHPTCRALRTEISNFLGSLTRDDCVQGVGSFIDLMRNELTVLLGLEADTLTEGFTFPRIAECRETLVTAMFDLTREPARNDALAFSTPCSGVSLANADYDGTGQNSNVECLLLVAAEADVQQFSAIANAARDVIGEGLQRVLEEGQTKCEGTNFEDGLDLLRKGLSIALVSVLEREFRDALADCHEKIKVAPTEITLTPGAQTTFMATTNYLSPDIRWSANGGTIPSAGNTVQYTAPNTPGIYTVTATDFLVPGISATATVTVQTAITVALSLRTDYAAIVAGGATEEMFPGAPLSGPRNRTLSNTGATVNHSTDANDAGGQLAFSAVETAHADSSSGYRGATSHEEISFMVSGGPVQIACSGTTSDDGIQDDSNQSGAAVIVDGVTYSGDATIDHHAQLDPGTHTLETYAFAEAGAPAKTFDASVSVTCSTS